MTVALHIHHMCYKIIQRDVVRMHIASDKRTDESDSVCQRVRKWERERKKTESECKTESVISVSNLLYYIHIHMLTHMRHSKWTNEPEHIVWSRNRLHKSSIGEMHFKIQLQSAWSHNQLYCTVPKLWLCIRPFVRVLQTGQCCLQFLRNSVFISTKLCEKI